MASNIRKAKAIVGSDLSSSDPEVTVTRPDAFLMVVDLGTGKLLHVSNSSKTALGFASDELTGSCITDLLCHGENKHGFLKDLSEYCEIKGWTGEPSIPKTYTLQMRVGHTTSMSPEMSEFNKAVVSKGNRLFAPVQLHGRIQFFAKQKSQQSSDYSVNGLYASPRGHPCLVVVGHRLKSLDQTLKVTGACKNLFVAKVSRDGHVVSGAKESMMKIWGYHPKELIQHDIPYERRQPLYDFVHPDDVEWVKSQFEKTFDVCDEFLRTIFRMKHKDGQYLCVDVETHAINEPALGTVLHLFVNIKFYNEPARVANEEQLFKPSHRELPKFAMPRVAPQTAVNVRGVPKQIAAPTPSSLMMQDLAIYDESYEKLVSPMSSGAKGLIAPRDPAIRSFSFQLTPAGKVKNMHGDLEALTGRSTQSVKEGSCISFLVQANEMTYVNESLSPLFKGRLSDTAVLFRFLKEDGTSVYVEMLATGNHNSIGEVQDLWCNCALMSDLDKYENLTPEDLDFSDRDDDEEDDEEDEDFFTCDTCQHKAMVVDLDEKAHAEKHLMKAELRAKMEANIRANAEAELRARSIKPSYHSSSYDSILRCPVKLPTFDMPLVTKQNALEVHGTPTPKPRPQTSSYAIKDDVYEVVAPTQKNRAPYGAWSPMSPRQRMSEGHE